MEETINSVQQAANVVFKDYGLTLDNESSEAIVDTGTLCLVRFTDGSSRGSLAVDIQSSADTTVAGISAELRRQLGALGRAPSH